MKIAQTCIRGHAWDDANTATRANGNRYCRACARERNQRAYRRRITAAPAPVLPEDITAFMRNVHKGPEHWLWQGPLNKDGYGVWYWHQVPYLAHRWLMDQWHGTVPQKQHVDHRCRTPRCVRPAHLEVVTPQVNCLRGVGPGATNAAKEDCPKCGGAYAPDPAHGRKGRRYCPPCRTARIKRHNDARYQRLKAEKIANGTYKPPRSQIPYCPQGHAYTPENTAIRGGGRTCRTCARDKARAYKAARRRAAAAQPQ